MDFSAATGTFTIGTDKKMSMSLDDIIKTNQKSQKKDRPRKSAKDISMKDSTSKGQRKKELVTSVTKKASAARALKFGAARGIAPSKKQVAAKAILARTTTSRFASRRKTGAGLTNTPTLASSWRRQQIQRDMNKKKKLQLYKQKNASASFLSNNVSSKPTITLQVGRNRNDRDAPQRRLINPASIRITTAGRGTPARSRANQQQNQQRTVNQRRGIQVQANNSNNNRNNRGSSLNSRFSGGVSKTTRQTGPRSFVTNNANQPRRNSLGGNNQPRGSRGGNGGGNNGGNGNRQITIQGGNNRSNNRRKPNKLNSIHI